MSTQLEPWLRGTFSEMPAVVRAVLHAIELAREDVARWCGSLNEADLNARPFGLPPVAFHLRHIVRSLDRLLTYAEGQQLSVVHTAALNLELNEGATADAVFREFAMGMEDAAERVRRFADADLEQPRSVGRKQLPSTVGGLLVHVADHTQRHVGQAITTAKILLAEKSAG